MKQLLIIYHSQSGNTERMAQAVFAGAKREPEITTCLMRALDAGLDDLLQADALLIGSPENFGAMAGAVKDFFDRTFYPAQEHSINLPYALFISAGNDGSGAIRQIERIVVGYPMKKVADPALCIGEADETMLQACEELGQAMAAGLALGIY
jgi:multimeric flavodoxin WrbA